MSQGRAEALCAKFEGASREDSKERANFGHALFFSTRPNKERRPGKIRVALFRDGQGFGRLDTDSCAGFTSSRPPPPMDLGISIFLTSAWRLTLSNLGLLVKTDWSVICLLCCLERWPWVGDNNPSRSRLL